MTTIKPEGSSFRSPAAEDRHTHSDCGPRHRPCSHAAMRHSNCMYSGRRRSNAFPDYKAGRPLGIRVSHKRSDGRGRSFQPAPLSGRRLPDSHWDPVGRRAVRYRPRLSHMARLDLVPRPEAAKDFHQPRAERLTRTETVAFSCYFAALALAGEPWSAPARLPTQIALN